MYDWLQVLRSILHKDFQKLILKIKAFTSFKSHLIFNENGFQELKNSFLMFSQKKSENKF